MEQNEEFPLSEKYIDFFKHDCSTEFLEGTTFAGKTTVAVPKFMFKVAQSPKKLHIIAGLDLGTIEKNIINKDKGLIEIFGEYSQGGCIEYNANGKGVHSLPHILYHTPNGVKVIYIVGYDNKTRWKKVLGGQYGCILIDEFNIADMDFVREIFMRCDYRVCTMNPDDPNKECYKQYVNKSRPIKKYENDAPLELLNMLNEEPMDDWTWWYFSFDHNKSLTPEKKQSIINSVPVGTKLWKNKIKGLRGKSTGLVFLNFDRRKHCITKEEAKQYLKTSGSEKIQLTTKPITTRQTDEHFIIFTAALDTAYSSLSPDTIAMSFAGITNKGKYILLDERVYNNANLDQPLAPSDTVKNFVDFLERNRKEWGLAKNVFIDSADQATIKEFAKYKRQTGCIYVFNSAWKAKMLIIDRINTQLGWFKDDCYFIVDTCINYCDELDVYSWKEDKDNEPEDGNDHMVNSCQYSWIPYVSKIGVKK